MTLLCWYDALKHLDQFCDSPIEKMFLSQFDGCGWRFVCGGFSINREAALYYYGVKKARALFFGTKHGGFGEWVMFVQPTMDCYVKDYRPDFCFFTGGHAFAIEIDGHDFHEKTKAQVARDKSRDRDFTFSGINTIRFTGSEVFYNAEKCLRDALEAAQDCIRAQEERMARRVQLAGSEDGCPNHFPTPMQALVDRAQMSNESLEYHDELEKSRNGIPF